DFLHEIVDRVGPNVLDVRLAVHLNADGRSARAEALHLLDRVPTVRGAVADGDAEALLEAAHYLPRAGERAGDVDAHLHVAAADHVHHVERRNDVGEERALDHIAQRLRVAEARRAAAALPRFPAAVADQVEAELAVGAFDRLVDLARRWTHPFSHELELIDQL